MNRLKLFSLAIIALFFSSSCCCQIKEKSSPGEVSTPQSSQEAKTELVSFEGAVGKLSAILQLPANCVKADCPVAILMHGFTSHKEVDLLSMIANKLQSEGVASLRFDFNGHGQSEGDFQAMTVPKEIIDAHNAYDYLRSEGFEGDVFLVGHSQGGVVAGMVAGELGKDSIKGVVLMAPAAVLRDDALRGKLMGVSYDPQNPPEYVAAVGRRVGREYILEAQKLPIYDVSAQYEGPVSIIHGRKDEIVPFSYAERYHDVYPNSELHLLDNENHGLNKNMNEVTDLAVDFILQTESAN